jgi:hypothetical protein
VENSISNYPPNQIAAWTYEEGGHKFYVLNAYGGSNTWVYDVSTGMWHERAYWDGSDNDNPCLARCHAYTTPGFTGTGGAHYVGALNSGKVYTQSLSVYTDDGGAIRRQRRAPHLTEEERTIFYHRLQLDIETGVFTGTPEATLRWSDDGGKTFAGSRTVSLDQDRIVWRRLGSARDRVFEVRLHDVRGPICIRDAYLDLT